MGLPKSLGKIKVQQTTDVCSDFQFSYDYYSDPSYGSIPEGKRLRLLNLKEVSCDGSIEKPPYIFTYQGAALRWRFSHSVDHWGFYNFAGSNEGQTINLPPTNVTVNGTSFSYGNADRETNESAMLEGMLTKIDYPTGGNTQFTFEANDYPVSETYSYREYSVQVSNCTYPHVCCGIQNNEVTQTFTSAQLSGARYFFGLIQPSCYGGVCTP